MRFDKKEERLKARGLERLKAVRLEA